MQPGLSLSQFIDKYGKYGTEQKCEEVLEKSRWPEGFRCPGRDNEHHCRYLRNGLLIFQYSTCCKKVSLTQGTIFHSTKLPLVKWLQAMFFTTQNKNNISILEMKKHLGVGYSATWRV